jgi:hypothetical protein
VWYPVYRGFDCGGSGRSVGCVVFMDQVDGIRGDGGFGFGRIDGGCCRRALCTGILQATTQRVEYVLQMMFCIQHMHTLDQEIP